MTDGSEWPKDNTRVNPPIAKSTMSLVVYVRNPCVGREAEVLWPACLCSCACARPELCSWLMWKPKQIVCCITHFANLRFLPCSLTHSLCCVLGNKNHIPSVWILVSQALYWPPSNATPPPPYTHTHLGLRYTPVLDVCVRTQKHRSLAAAKQFVIKYVDRLCSTAITMGTE